MTVLGDLIFDLVRKTWRFNRKKSKAEQRAENVWDPNRKHNVLTDGSCCICEARDVTRFERCPGPGATPRPGSGG